MNVVIIITAILVSILVIAALAYLNQKDEREYERNQNLNYTKTIDSEKDIDNED